MSTRPLSDRRALLVLFALALCAQGRPAHADDDPMSPYRERFKAGMERYTAGDLRGAVDTWEAIYAGVGSAKGYRVAFDLGRAYDRLGDLDRAGERYGAFLDVVRDRRAAGAPLEPIVAREETDARARFDDIAAREGRLRIAATSPVAPVRIDGLPARDAPFTVFVPPGPHIVTFAPGATSEAKVSVTVQPGQSLDVAAPPAPPSLHSAPASPLALPASPPPLSLAPAPAPSPPPAPGASERPFSPVFLVVAGGASVAAITVTIVEYARATSLRNDFDAASTSTSSQSDLKSSYDATRPLAYGALGASIGLTALTGALFAWYVGAAHGTSPRAGLVPTLALTGAGAQAGIVAHF